MAQSILTMVSVRCATYNQEPFIRQCLEGIVMQQTNFRFEAIVHDDASSDGTAAIIHEYAEKYPDIIKPIFEIENQYSKHDGSLRRILDAEMRGKYIAICEGDDYWTDPLKLQKQVDWLEEHKDFSMVTTAFAQIFEDPSLPMEIVRRNIDEIQLDDILQGLWIGTLTVLYRRDAVADYQPPFKNLPFGDLPLWCHLAGKGRVKYLQDVTGCYRSLSSSACHFVDLKKQYSFNLEAMRVREFYAQKANILDVVQPVFAKNAHFYLDQCFKYGYFDFPIDTLWHFVKQYGNPSGYDILKHWGMKSKICYFISSAIIRILKKIR